MSASSRAAISALIAAQLLAACSGGTGGAPDGGDPLPEPPREPSPSVEVLAETSTDFGLELVARVAATDPRANVVLSPVGASLALGIALNGAVGATFDAMRAALGFGTLTQEEINAAYRELIERLTTADPSVRLEIASSVWTHADVPIHDEFLQAVGAAFDASAESLDFADPATPAAINAWVEQHTGGMIDRIVDALDPALAMLLLNAIYFEGTWTTEFDPANTRRQPFQREDGTTVEVEMMALDNAEIRQARGPSYSAVELPYGNEALAMVIVLPDAGVGAREWLAGLDRDEWAALVAGLAPQRLDLLSIPKLELEFDAYLNGALQALGMDPAFKPGADFTRLSPLGEQMCIDFVRQRTRIEVDERGTRAAAATGVGIGVVSFTSFVVDRPFVLAIHERSSGALLFVGLVTDPTATEPGPEPAVSDCTGAPLQ